MSYLRTNRDVLGWFAALVALFIIGVAMCGDPIPDATRRDTGPAAVVGSGESSFAVEPTAANTTEGQP